MHSLLALSSANKLLMSRTPSQIFWKCPIDIILVLIDAKFMITFASESRRFWKLPNNGCATSHQELRGTEVLEHLDGLSRCVSLCAQASKQAEFGISQSLSVRRCGRQVELTLSHPERQRTIEGELNPDMTAKRDWDQPMRREVVGLRPNYAPQGSCIRCRKVLESANHSFSGETSNCRVFLLNEWQGAEIRK
jgi:hypothetical protein